jgi:hypothetical protein
MTIHLPRSMQDFRNGSCIIACCACTCFQHMARITTVKGSRPNDKTGGYPYQITTGPDGNLWFTDRAHLIVKMSPAGKFTTFRVPTNNGTPDDIAKGPDGNLWFTLDGTDSSSRIGRITPSGTITLFPLPGSGNDSLFLSGISAGPDGNLWFTYDDFTTNVSAIGRITTGGTFSLFPTPTANSGPTVLQQGQMGPCGSLKPSATSDASLPASDERRPQGYPCRSVSAPV